MIIDRFKSDIARLQEIARSLEDEVRKSGYVLQYMIQYDEEMVSEWAEERKLMVIDTNIVRPYFNFDICLYRVGCQNLQILNRKSQLHNLHRCTTTIYRSSKCSLQLLIKATTDISRSNRTSSSFYLQLRRSSISFSSDNFNVRVVLPASN